MPLTPNIQAIDMVHIMDGLTNGGGRSEFERMAGLLNLPPDHFASRLFNHQYDGDECVFHSMLSLFDLLTGQMSVNLFENMQSELAMGYMASQVRKMILKHVRLPMNSEMALIVLDTISRELGQTVVQDQIHLRDNSGGRHGLNNIEDIDPRFGNGY